MPALLRKVHRTPTHLRVKGRYGSVDLLRTFLTILPSACLGLP
ncbi:hypothetical protein CORC01_03424 [Colletotrichum orchidophilum]|uniref:Uncharacterized protein n=1 Tax=Colletotrichum orchidophilum TaxID=1209926 RepID=A0A1G4BIZ4_9PEZI|nr:uncharacterized protein CORC01_03424 [Colletotrichum orchidophilum]OHF01391.1 hypothetical protein CORC01_03424 [Colletotrichum orchidophilum]